MAYESSFFWKDWASYLETEDEKGLARFINCGCVMIKPDHFDFDRLLGYYRELGVAFEDWDLETLGQKMPLYDHHSHWPPRRPDDERFWDEPSGRIRGAVFTPSGGYVSDPQLATHNLRRAAEAKGARFLFNAEVAEVRRAGGRVAGVTLTDGEGDRRDRSCSTPPAPIRSRSTAWRASRKGCGSRPALCATRCTLVPSPEGFDFERDGCVTSDGDVGTYFRPELGNTILFGSEDPECDLKEWVDPDDFDRDVTEAQWKAQVYRLAKRMPAYRHPQPSAKGVVDLYDVSDDWIPIYDRSDLPGFYLAIGTSGNQFKNAPVVGEMMAELITACERGHDHDADPVKITGRYTGLELSVGFYSRRREINRDSSFSVMG